MMKTNNISAAQVFAVLILDILGVGLVFMPSVTAPLGRNGAYAALAALGLGLFYTWLISKTKFKSRVLFALYAIKTAAAAGLLLRLFSELIAATLLKNTDIRAIAGVMLLAALYGASAGGRARGRLAGTLMPLAVTALVLCLVLAAKKADISRLMPAECTPYGAGAVFLASLVFFPAEFVYTLDEKPPSRFLTAAAALGGAVLAAAAFVWQLRFNRAFAFPILDLTYNGDFSDVLVRHRESLLLTVLIAAQYFALDSLMYSAARAADRLKKTKHAEFIAAAAVFLCCILPDSAESARQALYTVLAVGDGFFLVLLPVILNVKRLWSEKI